MTWRSGELYPCETDTRMCEELTTGQEVEVDMDNDVLTVVETCKQYDLKPLGEVRLLLDDTVGLLLYTRIQTICM